MIKNLLEHIVASCNENYANSQEYSPVRSFAPFVIFNLFAKYDLTHFGILILFIKLLVKAFIRTISWLIQFKSILSQEILKKDSISDWITFDSANSYALKMFQNYNWTNWFFMWFLCHKYCWNPSQILFSKSYFFNEDSLNVGSNFL